MAAMPAGIRDVRMTAARDAAHGLIANRPKMSARANMVVESASQSPLSALPKNGGRFEAATAFTALGKADACIALPSARRNDANISKALGTRETMVLISFPFNARSLRHQLEKVKLLLEFLSIAV